MKQMHFLQIGMVILLIFTASACSSATPVPASATPTAEVEMTTATPEAATDTPEPSATTEAETPQPTGEGTQPAAGTGTQPAAAASAVVPPPAGQSAAPADKYQYVTQNLPDSYQVRPGTPMTISWTVKNVGTTGWSTTYNLKYFAGVKAAEDIVPLGKAVPPGGEVTVSVKLTAPTVEGKYNTWWKLSNAQSQNFGDVDFTFLVTATPGKATATP